MIYGFVMAAGASRRFGDIKQLAKIDGVSMALGSYNILNKILFLLLLIISSVSSASAKTKFIGTHKDWTAYSNKEKNGKTCFVASEPLKSSGKYNKSNKIDSFWLSSLNQF